MELPLTVPVADIVVGALNQLKDAEGLDRDEAYLLARLENASGDCGREAVLLQAIKDASYCD